MSHHDLADLRAAIDALATEAGRHCVVCARTGERPVPVDGRRFATRTDAAAAARLGERYRAALRERDPAVRYHDLVACEAPALTRRPLDAATRESDLEPARSLRTAPREADRTDVQSADDRTGDAHSADASAAERRSGPGDRLAPADALGSDRVAFCHAVAEALFRALRRGDHDDVERAVTDAYATRAPEVPDRDRLCLQLLDRIAIELETRLDAAERAAVCRRAAARLPPPRAPQPYPLVAAFERLSTVDLLGAYSVSPWRRDPETRAETCSVVVGDYALAPRDGRVTTLPLALDVLRRRPDTGLLAAPARHVGEEGLEFTLATTSAPEPHVAVRVPVDAAGGGRVRESR